MGEGWVFGDPFAGKVNSRVRFVRKSFVSAAYYTLGINCLTASRPRKIQKRSLNVVRVSLIPLCLTASCASLITSITKECFAGKRTGFLEFEGSGELLILPLHLKISSSRNNSNRET